MSALNFRASFSFRGSISFIVITRQNLITSLVITIFSQSPGSQALRLGEAQRLWPDALNFQRLRPNESLELRRVY